MKKSMRIKSFEVNLIPLKEETLLHLFRLKIDRAIYIPIQSLFAPLYNLLILKDFLN
jgi:hypothetical protein